MSVKLTNILQELDDLYGELNRSTCRGDVNPESVADTMLELMKLLGRALALQVEGSTKDLPTVARG